jgi:hypothetical protein
MENVKVENQDTPAIFNLKAHLQVRTCIAKLRVYEFLKFNVFPV